MSFSEIGAYLQEFHIWSVVLRLVLSVLLSGLIGLERERKQQAAGFRTHILVSLASTLVMLTNLYMLTLYGDSPVDPTRMAAQVISGIGFLGAGTIIVTGRNQQQIRGLTTAASLWASACVGLAVGAGFYLPSILATLLILGVVTFLIRIDDKYRRIRTDIDLYVEIEDITVMRSVIALCRSAGYKVVSLETSRAKPAKGKPTAMLVILAYEGEPNDEEGFLRSVEETQGVLFATVLNEL